MRKHKSVFQYLRTAYQPARDGLVPVQGLEQLLVNCFRAKVFEVCDFNRSHAALVLGISVRTFRAWLTDMRSMGYDWPESKGGGAQPAHPKSEKVERVRRYAGRYSSSLKRRIKK
jgi:hypothetical protein